MNSIIHMWLFTSNNVQYFYKGSKTRFSGHVIKNIFSINSGYLKKIIIEFFHFIFFSLHFIQFIIIYLGDSNSRTVTFFTLNHKTIIRFTTFIF
jgi:hypothetical protein